MIEKSETTINIHNINVLEPSVTSSFTTKEQAKQYRASWRKSKRLESVSPKLYCLEKENAKNAVSNEMTK